MSDSKQAVKMISLLWVASLVGAGCAFLTQVVLARNLGAVEYGVFSAAFATVSILIPIGGFGLAQFWLRVFGQEGWNARRWLRSSFEYIGITTSVVLISTVAWAAAGPHNVQMRNVIFCISLYFLGQVFVELVGSKFQLEGKFVSLSIWQLFPHVTRLLVVFVLVGVMDAELTASGAALIYSSVSVVLALLGVWQLIKMSSENFHLIGHARPVFVERFSNGRMSVFKFSWPFGLANFLYLIYFQSDIVLVKYYSGAAEAGAYSVAFTVIAGVILFPGVVYQKYLLPKMHRWAEHDPKRLYEVYRKGNWIMFLMGVLAMLVILVMPDVVLIFIFGDDYTRSVFLLKILSFSIPIMFLSSSVGAVLTVGTHIMKRVSIMGVVALVNLGLNFLLVPVYGAIGACITTFFSNFILLVLFYSVAQKVVFKDKVV